MPSNEEQIVLLCEQVSAKKDAIEAAAAEIGNLIAQIKELAQGG